jgi:hypothetical protein
MTRFERSEPIFAPVARHGNTEPPHTQQLARTLGHKRNVRDEPCDALKRCESRRKSAPTNGRGERISGCGYVDLSYIPTVEHPKAYSSDLP